MYDAVCVWSREDDFFATFVNQSPAARVLDLGCGTGRLTLAMAAAGHHAMMRWRSAEDVRASVTDGDLEVEEIYGRLGTRTDRRRRRRAARHRASTLLIGSS